MDAIQEPEALVAIVIDMQNLFVVALLINHELKCRNLCVTAIKRL